MKNIIVIILLLSFIGAGRVCAQTQRIDLFNSYTKVADISKINSEVMWFLLNTTGTAVIIADYCNQNGTVVLSTGSYTSYLWSTGDTTPTITVNQPGIYTLTAYNNLSFKYQGSIDVGTELVNNGEFSAGNTGFITDYTYNYINDGGYWITSDANIQHSLFYGTDHTNPGTGLFMSVNGFSIVPQWTVWQETVAVVPNTTYYFSFYTRSMNNFGAAVQANLRYSVNGTMLDTTGHIPPGINNPSGPFVWLRFSSSWNSGTDTSAILNITDLETNSWTNDFGLDDISFSTLPPRVHVISSNNTPICSGNTINLVANPTGGTYPLTYFWSGPGAFFSTLQNPSLANAIPGMGGYYRVTVTDAHGCVAIDSTHVVVNPIPLPVITGPSNVCINSTGNVYTTQAGMTNYIWSVSAGGIITAGGTATSSTVTVSWNTVGAQTVSVSYTTANGCSAVAPSVFNVTVNVLPFPTITGQNSTCVNSGYYNYTTESGQLNYVWNVSSGGIVNYGSGTNQIQVSWIGSGTQMVSVNYTNSFGCTAAAPTIFSVTVNAPPDQAGSITGTGTVCAGVNGVAYSVAPITGAATYVWTLPFNSSIASGMGTNSISVNFGLNAVSGNIIVFGNNLCGNGPASPAFPVNVNPFPEPAGTITGEADVCDGASSVTYSVAPIAYATGYYWTIPPGAIIVSGANTNSIIVDFTATAVSGSLTVTGTNSCGDGTVSPDFAVNVNPIPPVPIVTNVGDTLHSSAPTGNQWYFAGTLIQGATGQTHVATQNGLYWSIVTLNGCSSAESNHLQIYTTGINFHLLESINVYPVPNDGRFTASITTTSPQSFTISVYDNFGKKIYSESNVEVNGHVNEVIDLRPAPNGVYTVIFKNSLNQVVRKIVVNR